MTGNRQLILKNKIVSIVYGSCFVATSLAQGQVTIDVTSHADNDVITIFTPLAEVPATQFIEVEADTSGSIQEVHFGLDGLIVSNDWISGSTGSGGTQDLVDTSLYATRLDLVHGVVEPATLNCVPSSKVARSR